MTRLLLFLFLIPASGVASTVLASVNCGDYVYARVDGYGTAHCSNNIGYVTATANEGSVSITGRLTSYGFIAAGASDESTFGITVSGGVGDVYLYPCFSGSASGIGAAATLGSIFFQINGPGGSYGNCNSGSAASALKFTYGISQTLFFGVYAYGHLDDLARPDLEASMRLTGYRRYDSNRTEIASAMNLLVSFRCPPSPLSQVGRNVYERACLAHAATNNCINSTSLEKENFYD